MSEQARPPVATPIFQVVDLELASVFYRAMGFDVDSYDSNYAFVLSVGQELLHLQTAAELGGAHRGAWAYLSVVNVDDTHQRWLAADLPVGDIGNRAWGNARVHYRRSVGEYLAGGQQRYVTSASDHMSDCGPALVAGIKQIEVPARRGQQLEPFFAGQVSRMSYRHMTVGLTVDQ